MNKLKDNIYYQVFGIVELKILNRLGIPLQGYVEDVVCEKVRKQISTKIILPIMDAVWSDVEVQINKQFVQ